MLFKIATANSRKSKFWECKTFKWEEFVEILRTPKITNETQAEYFNFPKDMQDEIKDVGGFVGGELLKGQRKANTVLNRCLLTLDLDFATKDFKDRVFDFTYCIYSTRKHTESSPRFRLIIPLSRACSPDEYEALSRLIASDTGIDMFDDTTHEPHRLMYYPSISKNGEYVFKVENKTFLDVDKNLSRYKNWRDRKEWAVSSRVISNVNKKLIKQQNPTLKDGIVGVFCRGYNIYDAIEKYLTDVYEFCGKDRYTYVQGSTFGGMVVYDNGLFSYSNHSTDPTCGRLCNAFDLVRIHKFGHLDKQTKNLDSNPLPSYKAMCEFLKNDNDLSEWSKLLDKKSGNIQSISKAETIFKKDLKLKGKFGYDNFSRKILVLDSLPWNSNKDERQWTDVDDSGLRLYLESTYSFKNRNAINDAWILSAHNNAFNSVKDYLENLKWDKVKRLDTLFIDYLGVSDNLYSREVTRKSLVGAVARIFEPGIKLDTSLVLVGSQGVGKSRMVYKLGKDWFSDSLTTLKGKDAYEQIQGFWIIEIAELAAMRKLEVEAIKHFMSKQEDSFRGAYARNVETHKRQCIFICTTNTYDCLRDVSGGRRFWPLDADKSKAKKDIWNDFTDFEVDQIWAEALNLYLSGEKLILSKEASTMAGIQQELHTEFNPLEGIINSYLDMPVPENWGKMDLFERINYIRSDERRGIVRDKICVLEVWCEALSGDKKDLTLQKSREITDLILKNSNWVKISSIRTSLYGLQRGFKRV